MDGGGWPLPCMRVGPQDFAESVGQTRGTKNFRKEQKRLPRIRDFRDRQKRFAEIRVGRKLFDAGVEPAVHFCVGGSQVGLQPERISFRIVHQKARINAEETRQQLARCLRQMGPGAALDLREISLAQSAAQLRASWRCSIRVGSWGGPSRAANLPPRGGNGVCRRES